MRLNTRPAWTLLLLLMFLILALGLAGCVRPYPGSEAAASQPTPVVVVTQPIVQPPQVIATPDLGIPTELPPESVEPTPVPLQPTDAPATETIYVVVAGDTLFQIALKYGVSVEEIALANALASIDSLEIGQELIIPAPGSTGSTGSTESTDAGEAAGEDTTPGTGAETDPSQPSTSAGGVHVVQPGENLFRIGMRYGCTAEQMARHNGISNPARIYVGQEILIPDCS
jgi:LysM repeat protein